MTVNLVKIFIVKVSKNPLSHASSVNLQFCERQKSFTNIFAIVASLISVESLNDTFLFVIRIAFHSVKNYTWTQINRIWRKESGLLSLSSWFRKRWESWSWKAAAEIIDVNRQVINCARIIRPGRSLCYFPVTAQLSRVMVQVEGNCLSHLRGEIYSRKETVKNGDVAAWVRILMVEVQEQVGKKKKSCLSSKTTSKMTLKRKI